MVKKSFIFIIFSILIVPGLFSADIQKESEMTVFFEPGNTSSIEFGFASAPVEDFTSDIEIVSEYSRDLNIESTNELYAWWRIVSPEPFSITLYLQGVLESEYGATADWTISWDAEDERKSIGGVNNYGESKAENLYERKISASSSLGVAGSERLEFGLVNSDNLAAGEYKGILVMAFSLL